MRFRVLGLELERALEVSAHAGRDASGKGFEDRDSLTVATQHKSQRVVCIGVIRKHCYSLFAPFYRLIEKFQLTGTAFLGILTMDRRCLVGHRGAQGAELAARLGR